MTFEQLNYFLEVVRDMSFTKAANRLFISQSTLSRHIAALEDSLEAKLLERDTHSVKLTEAGAFLVQEGRELLRKKAEIEEKTWQLGEQAGEKVGLLMSPMQDSRIYQICNRFKSLYPNTVLNLSMIAHSESMVTEILQGATDLGITTTCELDALPPELDYASLWKDHYYLIVPNDHPLARLDSVSAADVEGEKILVADEPPLCSTLCASVHTYLGGVANRKKNSMQPKNLTEMTMQVMAGIGLAILPGIYCRKDEGYRALPIAGTPTEFDVVLLWKKQNANHGLEKLRKFILDSAQELSRA